MMRRILSVALFLCCLSCCLHAFAGAAEDSVFYDMYLSAKKSGDLPKAMEYASIFLQSADSVSVPPSMLSLAKELSEYYEDNFKWFVEAKVQRG